jgi:transposase-like protein
MKNPRNLQDAIKHFANPDNCIAYMVSKRWPDGVVTCPTCGRKDVSWLPTQQKWQCKSAHAKRQFSAKVGTIFEDSPIALEKWIVVVWMLTNCKNGVSSYEIARTIGVTQKSAWFMLHRIRLAMKNEFMGTKVGSNNGGEVEADETFVGGITKNMHRDRRVRYNAKYETKTVVHGILDREARQVRAQVVPNVKRETLQTAILDNVKFGSKLYTDNAVAYDKMQWRYIHEVVTHTDEYVRGRVHTNGIENFWSLLKRGLKGTYVAVEPFHLDRYVDEQVFRFNNRSTKDNPIDDRDRFDLAMFGTIGKRLTFAEITGKVGETTPF